MKPAPPVMRTVRVTRGAGRVRRGSARARGSGTQRTFWTSVAGSIRSSWSSIVHEHRVDQLLVEEARLEPEARGASCAGRCSSGPRPPCAGSAVCSIVDRPAEVLAGHPDPLGQLEDAELLGELVEDAELARVGRVRDGQARRTAIVSRMFR